MIEVHFFAQLRERLDCASLRIEYPGRSCVADIRRLLAERGGNWEVLASDAVLSAVNQTLCDPQQVVCDGDEVAFFPPVTGG